MNTAKDIECLDCPAAPTEYGSKKEKKGGRNLVEVVDSLRMVEIDGDESLYERVAFLIL